MRFFYFIIILNILFSTNTYGGEASNWLRQEIDIILGAYQNNDLSKEQKFIIIEDTINNNFAGAGIGKFVSGDSWLNAKKETKKRYIKLFKRHLALNIASMMQSYTNQDYNLKDSKHDSKNNVSLIDMKILDKTGNLKITWRIKESKERYFIIDLIVADISLVVTKRSEFNSMLKNVDNSLEKFNNILENQNINSYKKIIN